MLREGLQRYTITRMESSFPTPGRSHNVNLGAARLPLSPSSQEKSRGPLGQCPGRGDSHSTCKFLALPRTTSFLTQPIYSTRNSKISHRVSVTPNQPQICSQTLGRAGKPSSAPFQQLLPNLSSGWEVWECPLGSLEKGQHPWNGVEGLSHSPPKLPGAAKGSMS